MWLRFGCALKFLKVSARVASKMSSLRAATSFLRYLIEVNLPILAVIRISSFNHEI